MISQRLAYTISAARCCVNAVESFVFGLLALEGAAVCRSRSGSHWPATLALKPLGSASMASTRNVEGNKMRENAVGQPPTSPAYQIYHALVTRCSPWGSPTFVSFIPFLLLGNLQFQFLPLETSSRLWIMEQVLPDNQRL